MKTLFASKVDINQEKEIVDYMNTFVRCNSYNMKDFKWQYNHNNKLGEFYFLKDNEIFASQGMIPTTLLNNETEITSVKSESSFLAIDYRGKGYFEQIYFDALNDCVEKNIDLAWGFTALENVWKKKLGFECYDIFHECRIILSPKQIFKNSKSNYGKKILQYIINTPYHLRLKRILNPSSYVIKSIEKENKGKYLTEIYKEWTKQHPKLISIKLDFKYLEWRILNNPRCSYETLIINDEKNINIGFVICNVTKFDIYIVELIVIQDQNIQKCLNVIINKYLNCNHYQSISYLGNIKNPYNQIIISLMSKLGGKTKELKDMKFVLRQLSKNKLNFEVSHFTLNGLWTEGFKI